MELLTWVEEQIKYGSIFEGTGNGKIVFIETTRHGFQDEIEGVSLAEIYKKWGKKKSFKNAKIGETFFYLDEEYQKTDERTGKRLSDGMEWRSFK